MSLAALVGAALNGKDERLVARCNVPGILSALEGFGVYGIDDLRSSLRSSFNALQLAIGSEAPPSFLSLLNDQVGRPDAPTNTSDGTAPRSPGSGNAGARPMHEAPDPILPVVVTVRFNRKLLAERTTMMVASTHAWEAVAHARLAAVLPPDEAASYISTPLTVHLFETAEQLPSQRVGAAISDPVAAAFSLGYQHVVLSFEAPVHGPVCPPLRGGVDSAARMAAAAQ